MIIGLSSEESVGVDGEEEGVLDDLIDTLKPPANL